MNVCIYGAGAIGGHLAYRLIKAETANVTVIARGAHADALRSRGLSLRQADGAEGTVNVNVAASPWGNGAQDLVFVTLKTPSQPGQARQIASWLAPGGRVVFVNNGIPWWWHAAPEMIDKPIRAVDPENLIGRWIGSARSFGCVVYSQNEVIAPGVIQHYQGLRWILGTPDRSSPHLLTQTAKVLAEAELAAEITDDLRRSVWVKLLRNIAFSPISAIVGQDLSVVTQEPQLMRVAETLMCEVARLAATLGWPDLVPCVPTILAKLPVAGRPSMLQDRLARRPMELAGQLVAIQELATDVNVAMPTLDAMIALLTAIDKAESAH